MNTELLAIILGGGGAAMLTAIVQAIRSIRDGSRTQERDAYTDLEKSRRTETARREWAETERDYWHGIAAAYEFVIRSELPASKLPAKPPYPAKPKELSEEDDKNNN